MFQYFNADRRRRGHVVKQLRAGCSQRRSTQGGDDDFRMLCAQTAHHLCCVLIARMLSRDNQNVDLPGDRGRKSKRRSSLLGHGEGDRANSSAFSVTTPCWVVLFRRTDLLRDRDGDFERCLAQRCPNLRLFCLCHTVDEMREFERKGFAFF